MRRRPGGGWNTSFWLRSGFGQPTSATSSWASQRCTAAGSNSSTSTLFHGVAALDELLEAAKQASPAGLRLHVFTRNVRARRFYQSAGFVLVEQSDGSTNDKHEPDCTYTWAADPAEDSNAASDQSRSRIRLRHTSASR